LQENRAKAVVAGEKAARTPRFVKTSNGARTLDEASLARARRFGRAQGAAESFHLITQTLLHGPFNLPAKDLHDILLLTSHSQRCFRGQGDLSKVTLRCRLPGVPWRHLLPGVDENA
jgi:hypothetical protein